MSKLEYLYNFRQPVDPNLAATAEIIIQTNALMIDYIKKQFEGSVDPPNLRELAKNPLNSKDEVYGVPEVYCIFMKQVKQSMYEDYADAGRL